MGRFVGVLERAIAELIELRGWKALFALPLSDMLMVIGAMAVISVLFVGTAGLVNPELRKNGFLLFCASMLALYASFTLLKELFGSHAADTGPCPVGTYLDASTHKCTAITISTCPLGYFYDSIFKTCKKSFVGIYDTPGAQCPPNKHYSPLLSKCVCEAGYSELAGTCIKQPSTSCPEDKHYDWLSSKCVCNAGYVELIGACFKQTASCPKDKHYDLLSSKCVCDAGYTEFLGTCIRL